MDSYIKKILPAIACAVLSALFIVLMFFCSPKIEAVPETNGEITVTAYEGEGSQERTYIIGNDVTAVRINDLERLGRIAAVNYIPDKFVKPDSLTDGMQLVDLTKPFNFAEKGTLIFVVLNLDPWATDYNDQIKSLNEYKLGDSWRFTISLPKIFCASNIYLKKNLISQNGTIENYDFIEYTDSYMLQTDNLSRHTDRTVIDLKFDNSRELMSHTLIAAQIVTVHYQSTGGAYAGITECPLIGTKTAVTGATGNSQSLLIAFAILSAVVLAVFVVLSVLERSCEFVSAITWVSGIFIMLLARFFLSGATSLPLLWTSLWLASSFVVLCGALLANKASFGKVPANHICAIVSAAGAVLAFIRPFVPLAVYSVLTVVCTVVKALSVAALLIFIGFATFGKQENGNILRTLCSVLIDVAVLASLFLPQVFPTQYNPMFWMCVATVTATFISVFIIFTEMKKSNVYLTDNLHMEVERQIKDIKAIIDERDKLLQFVSHDMRKPLNSSVSLLDAVIEREKDTEQIKTLQIIRQNDLRVVANLSEIAAYAKYNYVSEPSQVVDLSELCEDICRFYSFDCNANGIVLKNLVNRKYRVFVKTQGLESALSNIIMNAVEHANCSVITLSAKSVKNKVVLNIADNGKGISADMDVFKPYVSENKPDTGGIGLYICKNIIESMNGSLTYDSGQNGTTFRISLLKA